MFDPIYTLGVDPGITGAWCRLKNGKYINSGSFPINESGKYIDFNFLAHKISLSTAYNIKVFIEHPWTQGNQGGTETIWRNYQSVFLATSFGNISTEIRPQKWQEYLGLSITKEEKKLKLSTKEKRELVKNKAFNFAKTHGGDIDLNRYSKKTGKLLSGFNDGLTDAFCIAYYGYLQIK